MKKISLLIAFLFFACLAHSQAPQAYFNVNGFAGTGNCDGTFNVSVCSGPGFPTYTITPVGGNTPTLTNICTPISFTVACNMAGWTYYFVVTYSGNNVFVSSGPPANVFSSFAHAVSNTQAPPNCNGMLVLDIQGGTPPYNISWIDSVGNPIAGQTNDTLSNLCSSNYAFKVSDNGSCTVPVWNGWYFRVPGLSCQMQTKNASCSGNCNGTAKLHINSSSQAIVNRTVSDGVQSANDSVVNACAGTYTATVTDITSASCQCVDTVKEPTQLNAQLGTVQGSSGNNGSIPFTTTGSVPPYHATLNGANTIYFVGGQQTYSGLAPGNYTVTVTDTNGCSQMLITQVSLITGMALQKQTGISIFPNPAKNFVTLKNCLAGEHKIQLKNISGNEITVNVEFTNEKEAVLDLSAMSDGIYFLQIVNLRSGEMLTKKIILEK